MSRIKGVECKIPKEILQTRRNGCIDNHKEKNEDLCSDTKDEAERQQISELEAKLPALGAVFHVHRKVGEGTFSSVWLGSLRAHATLPPSRRRLFAIKQLVPTAHPARIEHELRCLQDMGGRNHVIGVDLCLRHLDTIVFIMPYIPHRKFSEYVGSMDGPELAAYMRALLTALRHVHSFGVIHRDVKPSNFLYDRENRRYLLVDFGLAQRVCAAPPPPAHRSSAAKRPRDHEEESGPEAKRVALDLSVGARVSLPAPRPAPAQPAAGAAGADTPHPEKAADDATALEACACAGRGAVCAACAARPQPRAPRAGTQGFRPPEVLLKVVSQTTAVDVWAAGVVLASALCARYPLLRAPADAAALAELADLLGSQPLQRAAHKLGRRLVLSSPRRGMCLRRLCAALRAAPAPAPPCAACAALAPPQRCLCPDPDTPAESWREGVTVAGFPDSAFALAAQLLQPDPALRPAAAAALQHPFLAHC